MNRRTPSWIPLFAAILSMFFMASLGAAQNSATPAGKTPPVVIAPSWQSGDYWAQFDHQLIVDFGNLARFHDADAQLGPPAAGQERVVFMGDSITHGWRLEQSFPGKPYINRGISGQSTTQMLVRFRQDVINLRPKVVLIMGGTNDLAENTGPMSMKQSEGNIASMAQLAAANGIRPVLCSVLPSIRFWWHPGSPNPAAKIAKLNEWIKAYAAKQGYVYVNYYSHLKDAAGGLPRNLSPDGVHPLPAGYAIMAPLAQAGIAKALGQ